MRGNVSDEYQRHERPYELNMDVLVSIDAIQRKLANGYKSKSQVEAHESYLQNLHARLTDILGKERSQGIVNESLPTHIQSIARMLEQVRRAGNDF